MEIPVVFATDNNYLFYTVVAITSMAENASRDTFYHIYILVADELRRGHRLLDGLQRKYANVKIHLLPVDEREFEGVTINNKHITKATFYRLLLSELLREDKCLYLDSDIVVNTDLQELYSVGLGDAYIAGVRDLWIDFMAGEDREARRVRTGLASMDRYVNAGVLLFNLDRIRKMYMEDNFKKHMEKDYLFEDQDILNVCCYNGIKHLPAKWNLFTFFMGQIEKFKEKGIPEQTIRDMEKKTGILHYATISIRPWKSKRFLCNDIWWKYAEMWSDTPEFQRLEKSVQQREIGYSVKETARYCERYEKVYIWGFTAFGRNIMNALMERGKENIAGFIDHDEEKQRYTYCGKEVTAFQMSYYERGKCAIIIASQKRGEEVRHMLISMGIREEDIVCFVQKDEVYYRCLRSEFCEDEKGMVSL